jgi:hypothetical protein
VLHRSPPKAVIGEQCTALLDAKDGKAELADHGRIQSNDRNEKFCGAGHVRS